MAHSVKPFQWHETHHRLLHYLPSQRPLKDFIHHNTLHAFQNLPFHDGLRNANGIFGYHVYLTLNEFRKRYRAGEISREALDYAIQTQCEESQRDHWHELVTKKSFITPDHQRIGLLRNQWKDFLRINLDKEVHPKFFKLISAYLDQGIAVWKFPLADKGFIHSVAELERTSFVSLFRSERVRKILLEESLSVARLLHLIVGDEHLFERYLFDQQFLHPGWSGMIATLEEHPQSLLDTRKISLHDAIVLELLLEIDALDSRLGSKWKPLSTFAVKPLVQLLDNVENTEYYRVMAIWQEALEWSYYDQVIKGLQLKNEALQVAKPVSMQAFFCIDDRECSFRRYVEQADPKCQTFGTAGFYNIDAWFQPEHSKFHTKICPAPLEAKYLIREKKSKIRHEEDRHFSPRTHSLLSGWLISQSLGFLSAFKLMTSVWRPSADVTMVSSARHMDPEGELLFERTPDARLIGHLYPGYTVEEMADRVEGLLQSTGLTNGFARLIYVIGHGASSMNNTHYAGYDCGACSGRPGSVNARVFAHFANHPEVRKVLSSRGLMIPDSTWFVSALQDTTKDDIMFFDEGTIPDPLRDEHQTHAETFNKALDLNATERARRFNMDITGIRESKIHDEVKMRAVELFEPRPELNHATNALLIVGRREFSRHLFLDRRAFLNSYDPESDEDGNKLADILEAVTPVCGGINLEYYFSRTDNYRLGAGSKLPHNVMGLFGVANGLEGDLRTGLPSQMIEVHDPLRLLTVIEQRPDIVLKSICRTEKIREWHVHEWVKLVAIDPGDNSAWLLKNGEFIPYHCYSPAPAETDNVMSLIHSSKGNIPVHQFKRAQTC